METNKMSRTATTIIKALPTLANFAIKKSGSRFSVTQKFRGKVRILSVHESLIEADAQMQLCWQQKLAGESMTHDEPQADLGAAWAAGMQILQEAK